MANMEDARGLMKVKVAELTVARVVEPTTSITKVLEVLNVINPKVLFVCTEGGKPVGTISDGDIRRRTISLGKLPKNAEQAMNRDFFSVRQALDSYPPDVEKQIREVRLAPVLSDQGEVVGEVSAETTASHKSKSGWSALIMAGGEGLRLRPMTADTPKPLLPVGGVPMIVRILYNLQHAGFTEIFVSLGYLGEKIERYLRGLELEGMTLSFIRESEPLGTFGSLALLPPGSDRLLVVNGDVLTDEDFGRFADYHDSSSSSFSVMAREVTTQIQFGVMTVSSDGHLSRLEEKPNLTHLVNCGVYAIDLEKHRSQFMGQQIDATSFMSYLMEQDFPIGVFISEEMWIDVGRPSDLSLADLLYSSIDSPAD